MGPLQNPAIEYPEKVFEVELIVLGTVTHDAVHRTVTVLAQTIKGARRICKARYRGIRITTVRRVLPVSPAVDPGLFPANEF